MAHYLQLRDTLDTATSFGLEGERVELHHDLFTLQHLGGPDGPLARSFLQLLGSWMKLTGVLNELSRSMIVQDFYPFVLSATAVRKLYFVHRVIAAGERPARDGAAEKAAHGDNDVSQDSSQDSTQSSTREIAP